jgi:5-formyltetrahydrofolate cyclo-ligase
VIKPPPLTIGVAFEISRLNSIAPQSHDIRVSFIVTEMGIYRVLMGSTTLISNEECAAENPLR